MTQFSVAVLLTCFNRKEKTLTCLSKLYKQHGLGILFEMGVYLTDDSSTDGTAEAVHRIFPEVKISNGNGKLFWNRGMHLAWQAAVQDKGYDFYLWLNDDTTLKEYALRDMLECVQQVVDHACLVCGAISSASSEVFTYGGRTINGTPVIPNGDIQWCSIINGNVVLVSKEIYSQVGMLDPVFPHAIGDHDYGMRVLKKGYKIVTTKKYVGYCEKNQSLPKWCYSEIPLSKRMKALYSPLGNSHPKYFFIFESRYFGYLRAIKHFLSIHLRALMPSLWK